MEKIEDAEVEFVGEEQKIESVSTDVPKETVLPEKFCHFCGESLKLSFNIFNEGIDQDKHMLLPKGEGSHFNCYVKSVVFRKLRDDPCHPCE